MEHLALYLALTLNTNMHMKTILILALLCPHFTAAAQFNSQTTKKTSPKLSLPLLPSSTKIKIYSSFNGQPLTRLYSPTWATYLADERNVSNGEQNITPGFGDYKMPFYVYFRKYDAIYEAIERQKH